MRNFKGNDLSNLINVDYCEKLKYVFTNFLPLSIIAPIREIEELLINRKLNVSNIDNEYGTTKIDGNLVFISLDSLQFKDIKLCNHVFSYSIINGDDTLIFKLKDKKIYLNKKEITLLEAKTFIDNTCSVIKNHIIQYPETNSKTDPYNFLRLKKTRINKHVEFKFHEYRYTFQDNTFHIPKNYIADSDCFFTSYQNIIEERNVSKTNYHVCLKYSDNVYVIEKKYLISDIANEKFCIFGETYNEIELSKIETFKIISNHKIPLKEYDGDLNDVEFIIERYLMKDEIINVE